MNKITKKCEFKMNWKRLSVACAKKTLTSKYSITWLRCKIITATMKALRSGMEERKKVSIIVKE